MTKRKTNASDLQWLGVGLDPDGHYVVRRLDGDSLVSEYRAERAGGPGRPFAIARAVKLAADLA
jgi:hypothetical protein